MDAVFCVARTRDEHGKIIEYKLQDTSGDTLTISATALKELMERNKLQPINITLTRDGRLVTSGKHVPDIRINAGHEDTEVELLTDEQRATLSSLVGFRGRDGIIEDTISDLWRLEELLKKRRDLCRRMELPTEHGGMPHTYGNAGKVDRFLAEEINTAVADVAIATELLATVYCRLDIKEKINVKISNIADNIARVKRK